MSEKFVRDRSLTPALIEAVLHPFKIPESPTNAPEILELTQTVYGDLINALIRQEKSTNKIEESQFVGMQRESVIFTHSPVFKGSSSRTADAGEELRRWFRKNPTVATYWHHPCTW